MCLIQRNDNIFFVNFGLAALSYHNPCNTQTGKDLYFCLSYLSANVYFSFITVERMKTYFLTSAKSVIGFKRIVL